MLSQIPVFEQSLQNMSFTFLKLFFDKSFLIKIYDVMTFHISMKQKRGYLGNKRTYFKKI